MQIQILVNTITGNAARGLTSWSSSSCFWINIANSCLSSD